jgi:hypothetical protein
MTKERRRWRTTCSRFAIYSARKGPTLFSLGQPRRGIVLKDAHAIASWLVPAPHPFQLQHLPYLSFSLTSASLPFLADWSVCVGGNVFITAAGNSISSQLDSSCQGNRYGTEKTGDTARPSRTKSYLPGHSPPPSLAARRVGAAL